MKSIITTALLAIQTLAYAQPSRPSPNIPCDNPAFPCDPVPIDTHIWVMIGVAIVVGVVLTYKMHRSKTI